MTTYLFTKDGPRKLDGDGWRECELRIVVDEKTNDIIFVEEVAVGYLEGEPHREGET